MENETTVQQATKTAEEILENLRFNIGKETIESTMEQMFNVFMESEIADHKAFRMDFLSFADAINELVEDAYLLKRNIKAA